jgi:hypothetical protein
LGIEWQQGFLDFLNPKPLSGVYITQDTMNRREFLKAMGLTSSLLATGCGADLVLNTSGAIPNIKVSADDSLSMQLYKSLSQRQKETVCLPALDLSRYFISDQWYVLPQHRIHNTFNRDQQELIQAIFDSLHSVGHRDAVAKHMIKDQYKNPALSPSVAFYSTPEDADLEFIFTGHHVTRRSNVHSIEGQGFGRRPVFYGTFVGDFNESKGHPGNPYWYQGKIFNSFFKELSGAEQAKVLVASEPRSEIDRLVIVKKNSNWPGLACAELSQAHKKLLLDSMTQMLAIFRPSDVKVTMDAIVKNNMIDELYLSCYPDKYDIGQDKVWDTWQIEGPRMVWYFRGQPHIHCYFHLVI